MTKREKEYLNDLIDDLTKQRAEIERQVCCLNCQCGCPDQDWMNGMSMAFKLAQDTQINQALLLQVMTMQVVFESFEHEEEENNEQKE